MFRRNHNDDGTTDSICLVCFLPLGLKIGETNLDEAEKSHICVEAIARKVREAPIPGIQVSRKFRESNQQDAASNRKALAARDCVDAYQIETPPGRLLLACGDRLQLIQSPYTNGANLTVGDGPST
jgi:hypothetical protein